MYYRLAASPMFVFKQNYMRIFSLEINVPCSNYFGRKKYHHIVATAVSKQTSIGDLFAVMQTVVMCNTIDDFSTFYIKQTVIKRNAKQPFQTNTCTLLTMYIHKQPNYRINDFD